jgi:hypothetical protein
VAKEIADTDELRGARFTRVDLAGAVFRDVDLRGAKVVEAVLLDADVSGLITGLRVNGIEVAPLIAAELDRLHPERVSLRGDDPAALRAGWAVVESFWRPTLDLATGLPEARCHERVDDEWSLVETLRHLVFVTDAWFRRTVLGIERPYHPIGLAPTFLAGMAARLGLDPDADPSLDEVLAVREERAQEVRARLASVTAAELAAPRRRSDADGYPPASSHSVRDCLHVVMGEEWAHHQYATRDLAVLTA